jgi:site-specific recombinase XerD
VRRYQLHLAARGVGVPTLNQTVATLRFFFRVTLKRHEIVEHTTFVHEPRKLPAVLSPEEVARLLDAAPGLKYKAALSVAYGAGLRAAEVISQLVAPSSWGRHPNLQMIGHDISVLKRLSEA